MNVRRRWMMVGMMVAALAACGGDDTTDTAPTAEDAQQAAEDLVGGSAQAAVSIEEDGHALYEIAVDMSNGATLEVLLFAETLDLFEIKDVTGPFDYDTLDPLPGKLTYAEARAIAFETQAGDQEAWEVKYDDGPYFYEFYVRDTSEQLWEIKLWADSGEVFVTEMKAAVD